MVVRACVSIGLVGCRREADIKIPDEDLDGLTPESRDAVIEDYVRDWKDSVVSWDWERH